MSDFYGFVIGFGELMKARPLGFAIAVVAWCVLSALADVLTEITKAWLRGRWLN